MAWDMPLRNVLAAIIDDNRHSAEIVMSVLRSLGAREVRYAANEEDGLELFRREQFNLAIVDQNLGRGSEGLELVRRLRRMSQSQNVCVPVLMLTAYTERRRVLAARDAGITELLRKPFTARELVHRIDLLLNRPRDFIRGEAYAGPDRRRRLSSDYTGPEQRKSGA